MRNELTEIEQIERYLLNDMSPEEKQSFEAELNSNAVLAGHLAFQQNMMEGLERIGLKVDAQNGFRRYKIRKWSLQIGIPLVAIITGAIIWYVSTIDDTVYCDCEEAAIYHSKEAEGQEMAAMECVDTCTFSSILLETGPSEMHHTDTLIEETIDTTYTEVDSVVDVELVEESDEIHVTEEGDLQWEMGSSSNDNNPVNAIDAPAMEKAEPQFPGGQTAKLEFIRNNIQYPDQSFEQGITGTVHVKFNISETGKLSDFKIHKGVNDELNAEAMRVIRLMPDWEPGLIDGQPTAMAYILPIVFGIREE
jgi:TonB family protein